MENSIGNMKMGLLRSVKERALSKKAQNEVKPYLDKDCLLNILIRLPIDTLHSSRLVCKLWYSIINSPAFIEEHLRYSESVLIFLKSVKKEKLYPYTSISVPPEQQDTFSVEASFFRTKPVAMFGRPVDNTYSKFHIQFMEFNEGESKVGEYKVCCLGKIRASCDGLILLDNKLKKGGLIVMNPVTKKLMALPLGTLFRPEEESYGFISSETTGEYKVVHLFRDELGYVGCEILNLATRIWRGVDGPSLGLFGWFGYPHCSAIGALHWIPHVDHNDYIVSMEVDSEKFHNSPLPKSCRTYDRIIEMGEHLCFVTHEGLNIDIWSLKSLFGSLWTKQYTIRNGSIIDMVPVFSLRISGDLIFTRDEDGSFHAYDFKLQRMREVEVDKRQFPYSGLYLPHVSSLVSWTRSQNAGCS